MCRSENGFSFCFVDNQVMHIKLWSHFVILGYAENFLLRALHQHKCDLLNVFTFQLRFEIVNKDR